MPVGVAGLVRQRDSGAWGGVAPSVSPRKKFPTARPSAYVTVTDSTLSPPVP